MNLSCQRSLHVAMVTARALPLMGGIETHVHEVSTRLTRCGVDVTVLTTDRSGDLPREQNMGGYRVRRWRAYPQSRDYYVSPGLARHLCVERGLYDIVHVQGVHNAVAPTALASARRAGIPSVLTLHTGGHSSTLRGSIRALQWRILAPLLRSTAALVAVCEYERQSFAGVLGDAGRDIRLIRNGCESLPVDHTAKRLDGSPLLLSVGRLERYKGHHRILQALPAILEQAPDARLILVGSGPYEQPLRRMARELGVADRVAIRSFGANGRGCLGKLVAEADLLCLLSEYEAHPVAVMEALGAGTKALVADTSGLSELGQSGLVTTVALDASPGEIASTALTLAASPRCSPPELPTWDECAERLHELYLEVTT